MTPTLAAALDCVRVTPGRDDLHQFFGGQRCGLSRHFAAEGVREELRTLDAQLLAAAQRVERNDFHPPGQGFVDCPDRQQVCRAGQQKAAWAPVFIHTLLDGRQEIGRSLHFVNDHAIEIANEGDRIAPGCGQRRLAVEREKSAASTDEATCKRRLSRLDG